MEFLEALKELIKLPFEILNEAIGDSKMGYGFLMILFGSGAVTVIYYILDFSTKIIHGIFVFLRESFDSFTSIFKSKKTEYQKILNMAEDWKKISQEIILDIDRCNKKLDEIYKNREKSNNLKLD